MGRTGGEMMGRTGGEMMGRTGGEMMGRTGRLLGQTHQDTKSQMWTNRQSCYNCLAVVFEPQLLSNVNVFIISSKC